MEIENLQRSNTFTLTLKCMSLHPLFLFLFRKKPRGAVAESWMEGLDVLGEIVSILEVKLVLPALPAGHEVE